MTPSRGIPFGKYSRSSPLVFSLALALPKKYGGEKFLTIEGDDFVWAMEVDRKHANDAVEFAAEVNDASKKASK